MEPTCWGSYGLCTKSVNGLSRSESKEDYEDEGMGRCWFAKGKGQGETAGGKKVERRGNSCKIQIRHKMEVCDVESLFHLRKRACCGEKHSAARDPEEERWHRVEDDRRDESPFSAESSVGEGHSERHCEADKGVREVPEGGEGRQGLTRGGSAWRGPGMGFSRARYS